jgi:hypothetical protein
MLQELGQAMDCAPDGKAFRRLNGMRLPQLGAPYEVVLRNSRTCERTMRLWISCFNPLGIDGLSTARAPGPTGARQRRLAQ